MAMITSLSLVHSMLWHGKRNVPEDLKSNGLETTSIQMRYLHPNRISGKYWKKQERYKRLKSGCANDKISEHWNGVFIPSNAKITVDT